MISAPGASNHGRTDSGSVYVVFGTARTGTTDLASLGQAGFRIDGAAAGDSVALAQPRFIYIPAAGAGDVNGDGLADVLVGTPGPDNNGRGDSGSAYVVFGKTSTTNVDLASLGEGGFRIDGAAAGDLLHKVAGPGDVSGDGRPDLAVAGYHSAYVVFGKSTSENVDLAALGGQGFRIGGPCRLQTNDHRFVARAGDVNGDGRPDLLVAGPAVASDGSCEDGYAYVVFGKEGTEPVDLAALGARGFRIGTACPCARPTGSLLATGAGDHNADGRSDLLIGLPGAGFNGRGDSGSAYVVFGKATTEDVDLESLGPGGFRIDGADEGDLAGDSMAGLGDVDGDGRRDLLIGAPLRSVDAIAAYVVLDTPSVGTMDLRALAHRGFAIPAPGDWGGIGGGAAGDVNRDGLADILVGAPFADNNGRAASGSTYLVFGFDPKVTPPALGLSASSLGGPSVVVTAFCDEACALRASGTVAIRGRKTPLRLRGSSSTLAAPGQQTFRLELAPRDRKRLTALLQRGRRAVARVTVTAVDGAGNAASATRAVTLRR